MMYLHNEHDLFSEVIYSTSSALKLPIPIVEKDYYVTMILKLLSERAPKCVFKGGTSLSKCYHVIDRFSEDVDITFSNTLTQGERQNLKNKIISSIRDDLNLPIYDWDKTRSRRDYNCYTFSYQPLDENIPQSLIQGVKMEVSLSSTSFPTVQMNVDSYVYQFLSKENMDIVQEFGLIPFPMTIQSLERTLADKVFALCDYYLERKIQRHSRHIYDIYMLLPLVPQTDDFKKLVHEIRLQRAKMNICPSAQKGQNIPQLLQTILEEEIYKDDYTTITTYFQNKSIPYETVITALQKISNSKIFSDEEFE